MYPPDNRQPMLVVASHLVIGLIGALLLYVALFLRETEEGKLQNRLENLWIEIDDLSKAALSEQTAFLRQVSAMANSALNRLFGVRLLSAGAAAASVSFSVGSVLLLFSLPLMFKEAEAKGVRFIMLVVAALSFMLGASRVPLRYFGLLWIPGSALLLLLADWSHANSNWKWWVREDVAPLLTLLVGGFLSDILFIAVSRWCLRKSSELMSGWRIASLATLNGCVGLALIGPLIWGLLITIGILPQGSEVNINLAVLGASNLVTGAISFLFILLAIAALLHLAVWPLLERPIYSLQRFGVARNPKLLAAASVTCLVFAWPHSPVIQAITKLVHG